MKNFICCLLVVICYHYAQAQNTLPGKKTIFYGHVVDSVSGKAIAHATLLLINIHSGKKILESSADSLGAFSMDLSLQQGYLLTITAMGYLESIIKISAPSGPVINEIKLKPSLRSLKEVTVTARRADIKSDIDKLTYYAENDITSSAGDASDVLRKAPMVAVDPEGNVSLRGSNNPRILVNGRTSSLFLRSVSDALKSIPASEISRIEVITNPSAKYDGEGTGGIINIITKKTFREGMNGNMNAGMSNLRNNGSLNLTFKKNDFLIYTNINGNFSFTRKRPGSYVREDFVYETLNKQESDVYDNRRGAGALAGVDYSWKKYNQLQASIGLNRSNDLQRGDMTGLITGNKMIDAHFTRKMEAPGNGTGIDYYIDYTRRFKTADKVLSFSALVNQNNGNSRYVSDLQFFRSDHFFSEKADKKNTNTETTFQSDFSSGLGKGKIETGAKVIIRDFVNDFKVYNYDPVAQDLILNPARTNLFQFNQNVIAGYIQYSVNLSKTISFRSGIRTELTTLSTASDQFQQTPAIKTDYVNILPNFAIVKNIASGNRQLKISYSKRLQRPGAGYLNPFISASDSYNRTQGNPYLQPEIVHSPELSYTLNQGNNFYGITFFYRVTKKAIERYTTLSTDTTGVVSTSTYDNIGSNKSRGINLTSSLNIQKNLSLRTNLNINTYDMQTLANKYYFSSPSATSTVLSMNINAGWRLNNGISLESFFTARTSQKTIQGYGNGFTLFNAAVRKNILNDAASIGFMLTEPFRKGTRMISERNSEQFYEYTQVLTPNRSVAVNFSLNFGKLKARAGSRKIQNDDLK